MKEFLFSGGLMLLSMAVAFGGPCLPGTLQTYINLGSTGCQIGAVQFADFTVAAGQAIATPISPGQVQVSPGGGVFNPALLFTLNQTATAGQLFESFFRFDVSGTLTGASISLGSPATTGDGAVTGILDVCRNGLFSGGAPIGCSGSAATAIAFAIAEDSQLSDSVSLGASSFFDVFVDLTADAGLSGSATLPSASVSISAVPEPGAMLLAGAGLALIGVLRARRKI